MKDTTDYGCQWLRIAEGTIIAASFAAPGMADHTHIDNYRHRPLPNIRALMGGIEHAAWIEDELRWCDRDYSQNELDRGIDEMDSLRDEQLRERLAGIRGE